MKHSNLMAFVPNMFLESAVFLLALHGNFSYFVGKILKWLPTLAKLNQPISASHDLRIQIGVKT